MTTMKEFQAEINKNAVNKMIEEIEKAIENYKTGRYYWINAIIDEEFPLNSRDEVAKKYIEEGGWYATFHKTSSENGERPGFTSFGLFTPESYAKWDKACGEDYKSKGHIFFNKEII